MIDFVQIRNENLEIIGIIDTAKSIIWHKKYFGVGDFEVYVSATRKNRDLLEIGNYITRINDDSVGIVERIEIKDNPQDGLMIIATGRFAKSILDRRIIYTLSENQNIATLLVGNVESAARALVVNNAISCAFNNRRNIPALRLGAHSGSTKIIVDEDGQPAEKQVVNENLLTYTDDLLREYDMSAKIVISSDETKLEYVCFSGIDRSMGNSAGLDAIIFSSDFDNLSDSDYSFDEKNAKNAALIGGEGEGLDKFYSAIGSQKTGLARREIFVDAKVQRKYKDEHDTEHEYTDEEYEILLNSSGMMELSQHIPVESFSGTIATAFGMWTLGIDYSLGDIVTIQDNKIGVYANVRIVETTEVQDENGYAVSLKYE